MLLPESRLTNPSGGSLARVAASETPTTLAMDDSPTDSDEAPISDSEFQNREAQFENRNPTLQHVIDVLASYDSETLHKHGMKAEIARERDIEQHRIYYVLHHWGELVSYRRHANANPLDPDAVKEAYDDPTLEAMAGASQPVADGASTVHVDVELTLDEVFRAIKLLPGDLGMKVYSQALSAELPRAEIRRILNADE